MFKQIKQLNAQKKIAVLLPFFTKAETLLDFGCGDLLLSEELYKLNNSLKITGVDVVDFGLRPKGVEFYKYDGKKLPFKDKSFDTVLAFHTLHHCSDPIQSFYECQRVAKKRLIIIEPVYRVAWEIPLMRLMDFIYNVWKSKSIDMNYKFHSKDSWLNIFRKNNLKVKKIIDIEKHPEWLPIGRGYLFVAER